jgi:pimeloyl-ACP methyl ester carboxylesterase
MQIIVQDLLTHYQRQGSGKTILLLHGWADRLETFEQIVPELALSYDVIALDLPGFGRTQAPHEVWNLDNYSDFLQAFVKKLNITQLHAVIGHSNGGALAIRALATEHLVTDKLVLLSASGVRDTGKLGRAVTKTIAKTGKVMAFWLPKTTKQKLQKKLYGTIGSDMLVAPHLQETFKLTVRQDVQKDAAKLKIPALLVYGDQDKATPVNQVGERFLKLISNSRLETISGADHFVHQADSARVSQLILEFLK